MLKPENIENLHDCDPEGPELDTLSIVVGGLQMVPLLEGITPRLHSCILSLPVGHLVVEEAWECLLCFRA